MKRIGLHRKANPHYRLLFHDTHHRGVTDPDSMAAYDLRHYDGVLAFGSRSAVPYSDDIVAFMGQIAAVVAIAMDNGINWENARRHERDLRRSYPRINHR